MNENIIAINVPNAVSITIMAIGGALVVGLIRKFAKGHAPAMAPAGE